MDKYDEKAHEVYHLTFGVFDDVAIPRVAAALRESAAQAYEDASACVGMAALQLADMEATSAALVASGDLFAKKAAALRRNK